MSKNQTNQTNQTKKTDAKVETFDKNKFIAQHGGTKSGAIRALLAQGKTRGEVAKMLGVIYQHVRNVAITPIKNPKVATVYIAPVEPEMSDEDKELALMNIQ